MMDDRQKNLDRELGPLADHVASLRAEVIDPEVERTAQRRLQARISEHLPRQSAWQRISGRMAWIAPMATATLVVLILVVGGPTGPKAAFAQVQRYFQDFEFLHATVQFEAFGNVASTMDIYVERGGRSRIDTAGEVTHIIDPAIGEMITLLHEPQTASLMELPPADPEANREELDWLHRIRSYQGLATPLAEPATINGVLAIGYQLELNANQSIVVWAASDNDEPLRVEMEVAGGAGRMTIDLNFDIPTSPEIFAIPEGYQMTGTDEIDAY